MLIHWYLQRLRGVVLIWPLWTFLSGTLVTGLYPTRYDSGWLDKHNRLIGGIKLTQLRNHYPCEDSISKLWSKVEPRGMITARTASCYSLNNASAEYTSSVTLDGKNGNATAATIAALQGSDWIDGATQLIGIDNVIGNVHEMNNEMDIILA